MMERAGSLVVCDPSDGGRRIIVTMMKTMTMMIKVQRETEHSFASGRRQEYYSRSGGECERGDRDDHISHSRGADRRSGEGHGLGAAQLGRSRGTRSFGDSEWNAFSAQTRGQARGSTARDERRHRGGGQRRHRGGGQRRRRSGGGGGAYASGQRDPRERRLGDYNRWSRGPSYHLGLNAPSPICPLRGIEHH